MSNRQWDNAFRRDRLRIRSEIQAEFIDSIHDRFQCDVPYESGDEYFARMQRWRDHLARLRADYRDDEVPF